MVIVRVGALFLLLTALAFIAARGNADVLFAQVLNTVRVTMVLYTLAMGAFLLLDGSAGKRREWLWLWTFAFISYVIHVAISFIGVFDGSFAYFFSDQGALVATVNLIVTVWWSVDIVLAWTGKPTAKWVHLQRAGIHYLIWGTFFLSTVISHNVDHKQGFVVLMGIAQTVFILICLYFKIRKLSIATRTLRVPTLVMSGITALLLVGVLTIGRPLAPYDWGDHHVLNDPVPDAPIPTFNGQQIPYQQYLQWIEWGEEWFRNATFGNERYATDITGVLNAPVDVPDGQGGYTRHRFFKFFLEGMDALDGARGNLYTGNGGGYTHDLVVNFPAGSRIHDIFELPERLHMGLDVEAGAAWPIGLVPIPVPAQERGLPYLMNPAPYAAGATGVGPDPSGNVYRVGFSCALCHYSLDVDWDGQADLQSARMGVATPGSLFKPEDAWVSGNQDLHFGWLFATGSNPLAGIFASGQAGGLELSDANEWIRRILAEYETQPAGVAREVVRGALLIPRGYFDDTPDAIPNSLQYPLVSTHWTWPYNYDGVMLNATDRNNNVWAISLDPTQLVGMASDRLGESEHVLFWRKPGIFRQMTARQYAELSVEHSPAVKHDRTVRDAMIEDILGTSDGMPGITDLDAMVLIREASGAVPDDILNHTNNVQNNRVRPASEFGPDGEFRGQVAGLLGTKVITPPSVKQQYGVNALEQQYGLNGDEFMSNSVSLMLDWVKPPTNHTTLLANARGMVADGYDVFKDEGCADCHAGPFFTNNRLVPLRHIQSQEDRALATEPLQTFIAPEYDPATGLAVSKGVIAFIRKILGNAQEYGYKVVTLRSLWATAPYLHDGGVGVALRPGSGPAGDDLQALLRRPPSDQLVGMGQVLAHREANPGSYTRPNAALSLQAVLLRSERAKVIAANHEAVYPIPGTSDLTSMVDLNIQGVGHPYYVKDEPGGDRITALIAFLLALDDDPAN